MTKIESKSNEEPGNRGLSLLFEKYVQSGLPLKDAFKRISIEINSNN
jgi:hypothetical protein